MIQLSKSKFVIKLSRAIYELFWGCNSFKTYNEIQQKVFTLRGSGGFRAGEDNPSELGVPPAQN